MSVVQLLTYNDPEQEVKYASELEVATKKLQDRNSEVIDLQKKVIELYEEIRNMKTFV
jgi:hypothetical protein